MARVVVDQKLDSLQRCLARVAQKCPPSAAALAADVDAQDVIVLNLSRSVQLCVDIALHLLAAKSLPAPQTMGGAFDALAVAGLLTSDIAMQMRQAVGFRNLAVHSYDAIDWSIVHTIATKHLEDFRRYAGAVNTALG